MKNKYFQYMQRVGIEYRKQREKQQKIKEALIKSGDLTALQAWQENETHIVPPFSQGQSFAYKFWAIADRYDASDIYVDELPRKEEVPCFIDTYRAAGITTFALAFAIMDSLPDLVRADCYALGECKIYRRERYLYNGRFEMIKGLRIMIRSSGDGGFD